MPGYEHFSSRLHNPSNLQNFHYGSFAAMCRCLGCGPSLQVTSMSMREQVQEGFMVFAADGASGIGSVREVRPGELLVYIENAGDFVVPLGDVKAVHSGKVVLDLDRIEPSLRMALDHVHDAEDPDYDASGADMEDAPGRDIEPPVH